VQQEETCVPVKTIWELTFDVVPDLIAILDKEHRIVQVNKAMAKCLGVTPEKCIGQYCYACIHEAAEPPAFCPHAQLLHDGQGHSAEVYEPHLGGHFLVTVSPIFNDQKELIGSVHIARDITERKRTEEALEKTHYELELKVQERTAKLITTNMQLAEKIGEIQNLKEKAEEKNIYLQEEIKQEKGFDEIIGKSNVLNYVFFRVRQVAGTVSTVLLLGETGTGKECIAHAIHNRSPRKEKIFVTVNCAALPSNIIESELFGREKGAFTGSHAKQIGRFELAHGGTIFLDEIGELSLKLQSKLLKVVQDGAFERLGSPHTIKVDVRMIASTNRNLADMVQKGRFREDLYYRLNVFPITIPPLRQRKDDIPLLVEHFTKYFAQRHGIKIEKIPKDILTKLQDYNWPGNVRELQNVIERAVITSPGDVLRVEIPAFSISVAEDIKPLDDLERDHIHKVLEKTKGRIAGPQGAAILLGMNPSTLRSRLIKLGIKKRGFRSA
jgi:formate hydrogenlyase transcriptional activator